MATLATLRSYVRNLVLERQGDTGLITDTEANDIINIAARLLYNRIVSQWPEAFAQRSASNVACTSSGVVALTSVGTNVTKILSVSVGATSSQVTAQKPIPPLRKAKDEMAFRRLSFSTALPSRWYVEGSNLVFLPLPSGSFDFRAVYVAMPTDMAADGNVAWSVGGTGILPELHDVIAVLAAIMVLAKDTTNTAYFKDVFSYIDKVMIDRFGAATGYDPKSEVQP